MRTSQRQLIRFFSISFAWAWLLNVPRIMATRGTLFLAPSLDFLLGNLAILGPMIAAFYLTWKKSGSHGIKDLLKRGGIKDFEKKWWLPSLFLLPLIGIVTWLIMVQFNVPIIWQAALPPALIVPIGLVLLLTAYPEEFGWRGFAIDELLRSFNPLTGSLILGFMWGLWHLPLHFIEGTTQFVIPVWEYIAQTTLLSVLYTWIYFKTNKSLLTASVFHATGNIAGATIPFWTSREGRWINFALLLVVVIYVVIKEYPTLGKEIQPSALPK